MKEIIGMLLAVIWVYLAVVFSLPQHFGEPSVNPLLSEMDSFKWLLLATTFIWSIYLPEENQKQGN